MTVLIQPDNDTFVSVRGARAAEFLQGQLSCNVPDALAAAMIPGTYNTPKGRVISNFMLGRLAEDHYLLRMRADVAEVFATTLGRYAALSRVKVGVDPQAANLVFVLAADPQSIGDAIGHAGAGVLAVGGSDAIKELWLRPDSLMVFETAMGPQLTRGDNADLARAQIAAGQCQIDAGSSDKYLPNMLGFTRDGSVHFRKGCYTGQEIIARAHYRGAVKRELTQLRGTGPQPAVGSEVVDAVSCKPRGELVMVTSTTDGTAWIGLGVLSHDETALAELCVNNVTVELSVINSAPANA